MTAINKQRFLPELGKLLTFMVEEDRQTALAMYSRLFDDAADEQQLMDLLVSPTRQAVVIARTYDAKERKQQLESSKEDETETPAFVLAIDKIYQQVAPKEEKIQGTLEDARNVLENNQFSLFQDDAHPIDDSEYVPFQIEAESVPIEEEALEEAPAEEQDPLPEQPEAPEASGEEPESPAEETQESPEEPAREAASAEESAPAEAETLPENEETPSRRNPPLESGKRISGLWTCRSRSRRKPLPPRSSRSLCRRSCRTLTPRQRPLRSPLRTMIWIIFPKPGASPGSFC